MELCGIVSMVNFHVCPLSEGKWSSNYGDNIIWPPKDIKSSQYLSLWLHLVNDVQPYWLPKELCRTKHLPLQSFKVLHLILIDYIKGHKWLFQFSFCISILYIKMRWMWCLFERQKGLSQVFLPTYSRQLPWWVWLTLNSQCFSSYMSISHP